MVENMIEYANFSDANGNAVLSSEQNSIAISYEGESRVWTQLMYRSDRSSAYVYSAKQWGGEHLAERGVVDGEIRDCLATTIIMFMLSHGKSVDDIPELPTSGY